MPAPDRPRPQELACFDFRESDLASRGLVPEGTPEDRAESYKIKIGYTPVAGTQQTTDVKHEWWHWFAGACLAVLLVEWYIYNRRVYI
jgi:hypothetical protein